MMSLRYAIGHTDRRTDVLITIIRNSGGEVTTYVPDYTHCVHIPYFIFTARCYASAVHAVVVRLSVRLSVCPSITRRYCIKTAKRRITETTPYDSPVTLVFGRQRTRRNSNRVTPKGGVICMWGRLK